MAQGKKKPPSAVRLPFLLGVEETLMTDRYVDRTLPPHKLEEFCARVDSVIQEGLGNLYVIRGYSLHPDVDLDNPASTGDALTTDPDGDFVKLMEYAARRGLYVMTIYTRMTPRVVAELKRRCGDRWLGNCVGEAGGHLPPQGQPDMRKAAESQVKTFRTIVDNEWKVGHPHVCATMTNIMGRYCMAGGMDIAMGEIFASFPCVDVHFASLRGTAHAYGSDYFAGWMACGWYGGGNADPQKPLRHRAGYRSGFLHGASLFVNESGHWEVGEFYKPKIEGPDNPLARTYRQTLREFYAMAQKEQRPAGGPEVGVGLIQGRFDGYTSWAGGVWGQQPWYAGAHEGSWELLNVFYPEYGVITGGDGMDRRRQRLSGTPYGLADIVPAEAPVKALSRYKSLLFLGWNTMDEDQYRRLIAYVRQGGRLVMWASHLNASADRRDSEHRQKFFRNGDFRELFGARVRLPKILPGTGVHETCETCIDSIRWVRSGTHGFPVGRVYYSNWPHGGVYSDLKPGVEVLAETNYGRPFVTEYKLGKGRAVLVHCYSPQGQRDFREIAEDIFRCVGQHELSPFRVEGNPRLSYAVYGAGAAKRLYVLNTNLENQEMATLVEPSGRRREIRLDPTELRRFDAR